VSVEERGGKGGAGKREGAAGYAQLRRASSEEELVVEEGQKRKKARKVFAKLKVRAKPAPAPAASDKPAPDAPRIRPTPHHSRHTNCAPPAAPLFGVALADALRRCPSHDLVPVPAFVRFLLDRVDEAGGFPRGCGGE